MFEWLFGSDKGLAKRVKGVEEALIEVEGDIATLRRNMAKINGQVGANIRTERPVKTEKDRVIEALAKDLGMENLIDITDDIKNHGRSSSDDSSVHPLAGTEGN